MCNSSFDWAKNDSQKSFTVNWRSQSIGRCDQGVRGAQPGYQQKASRFSLAAVVSHNRGLPSILDLGIIDTKLAKSIFASD